jgi:PAS domain-containing protein
MDSKKSRGPYLVWKIRGDKEIIEANDEFQRYFHIGHPTTVDRIVEKDDLEEHISYNRMVFSTKTSNIRVEKLNNQHEIKELCVYRQPKFDDNGSVDYVLCEAYEKNGAAFPEYVAELGQNHFRDIVESVNELIAITDTYGVYQYVSPQWEQTLGYTF